MRLKGILGVVVLSIALIGCSASKKVLLTNPVLDTLMAQKKMRFKVTSANPVVTNALSQIAQSGLIPPGSSINRINLAGAGNFLKIYGDSVSANLSYYGERQIGGGYNNNTGIKFNGVPDTFEIVKDDTKKSYRIKFNIREQTESFNVYVQINRGLAGTIAITSSHRTGITYTGIAEELPENK